MTRKEMIHELACNCFDTATANDLIGLLTRSSVISLLLKNYDNLLDREVKELYEGIIRK